MSDTNVEGNEGRDDQAGRAVTEPQALSEIRYPEAHEIHAPEYRLLDWEIEEAAEILLDQAIEFNARFNLGRPENGRPIAHNAYQATSAYTAIEAIRQLQSDVKTLQQLLKDETGQAHDFDN